MGKTDRLTDDQLREKAHACTLTPAERIEYLVRIRGMLRKDAIDHAAGKPKHVTEGKTIWVH